MRQAIIVGLGLAGFHYALELKRNKKDFYIISNNKEGASRNAGGVANPTILKRYSMSWRGIEFHNYAISSYQLFENTFNTKVYYHIPIHYFFNQMADHNKWAVASKTSGLDRFLSSQINNKPIEQIKSKFGYGELINVGKLNIIKTLDVFEKSLESNCYSKEEFDYNKLKIYIDKVEYKGVEAKYILFCEGFKLKKNPWFSYLPLVGSKGEYLHIRTKELSQKKIIKSGLFIIPIDKDLYWVGSNFERYDKTSRPTEVGKAWLLNKLNQLLNVPFEVLDHRAAIRPTVLDRRPLLGGHPKEKNIYVFNGLGTRGVLIAPLLAHWMYSFLEEKKELLPEIAIDRFETYFSNPKKEDV